jgi:hypothetical protein
MYRMFLEQMTSVVIQFIKKFHYGICRLISEMFHMRDSEYEWLCIYTDRSPVNKNRSPGAGIMCELFAFYTSLGPNTAH